MCAFVDFDVHVQKYFASFCVCFIRIDAILMGERAGFEPVDIWRCVTVVATRFVLLGLFFFSLKKECTNFFYRVFWPFCCCHFAKWLLAMNRSIYSLHLCAQNFK